MFVRFVFYVFAITILGCAEQSLDKYKERAQAEEEAGRDVENENLARRARAMELDLRKRYKFYTSISNDYQGQFKINKNSYMLRIIFLPTLHILETERVRSLEEIQDDLSNLFLNAEVRVWSEESNIGVNTCVFEKIKPDMNNGWVQLMSSSCSNRFLIKLTENNISLQNRNVTSANLARAILNNEQTTIDYLQVEASSRFNPNGYEVLLKQIE